MPGELEILLFHSAYDRWIGPGNKEYSHKLIAQVLYHNQPKKSSFQFASRLYLSYDNDIIKIGINASFLRKIDTGIGQVTNGFVHEISKSRSKKNEYFLYLERDIDFDLPKNFQKRVFLPMLWRRDDLIRKIWWEKFLLPRKVKKDGCAVFISLYQCPTFFSKNIRHKMLVHDLIPKVFPEYLDNWRKKFYFYLSGQAVRHVSQVLTVSEWSKRDIHKYLNIPKLKIKVAYPGVAGCLPRSRFRVGRLGRRGAAPYAQQHRQQKSAKD